jgi:hypothetical protein
VVRNSWLLAVGSWSKNQRWLLGMVFKPAKQARSNLVVKNKE